MICYILERIVDWRRVYRVDFVVLSDGSRVHVNRRVRKERLVVEHFIFGLFPRGKYRFHREFGKWVRAVFVLRVHHSVQNRNQLFVLA